MRSKTRTRTHGNDTKQKEVQILEKVDEFGAIFLSAVRISWYDTERDEKKKQISDREKDGVEFRRQSHWKTNVNKSEETFLNFTTNKKKKSENFLKLSKVSREMYNWH